MSDTLDTVLLLALPASGKSEVRRYLHLLPPDACRKDFHMAPTVQLDDFPYVHFMRRVDETLVKLAKPTVFFHSPDRPFKEARDWGTLIGLVNEDHAHIVAGKVPAAGAAGPEVLDRLEAAAAQAGIGPRLARLDSRTRAAVAEALEAEAAENRRERVERARAAGRLDGKTLVVEFARGGPQGSALPLAEPFGYRYSLSQLSPAILEKAVILYVWVTPEESRRKNRARTDPDDPGSILHHGVPEEVMLKDYGADDMDWLEANSGRPGMVAVKAGGRDFQLPVARFDNRVDKTSFLREEPAKWDPKAVKAVHQGLKGALDALAAASLSGASR